MQRTNAAKVARWLPALVVPISLLAASPAAAHVPLAYLDLEIEGSEIALRASVIDEALA